MVTYSESSECRAFDSRLRDKFFFSFFSCPFLLFLFYAFWAFGRMERENKNGWEGGVIGGKRDYCVVFLVLWALGQITELD